MERYMVTKGGLVYGKGEAELDHVLADDDEHFYGWWTVDGGRIDVGDGRGWREMNPQEKQAIREYENRSG